MSDGKKEKIIVLLLLLLLLLFDGISCGMIALEKAGLINC